MNVEDLYAVCRRDLGIFYTHCLLEAWAAYEAACQKYEYVSLFHCNSGKVLKGYGRDQT